MWEAIASNRRRSVVLIGAMGALLVVVGYVAGAVYDPGAGGVLGVVVALGYWLALLAVALVGGDRALLLGATGRQIRKEDEPRLWNVVEEMTIASGLGTMPRVYVIDESAPNAFAAGPRPDKAVVAVTTGLLKRLNRDELQGVIAHEIGHIRNLDVRFMTIAAIMVASIAIIADLFMRSLWFGGGRRRGPKIDPRVQAVILAAGIVAAVLAPFFARLLYLACSRQREYLADASAARFTRYPEGLASALEKIALRSRPMKSVNRALAPLWIVNPLQRASGGGWLSTHPPTEERIRILRSMGGGAGYVDYENAFRRVHGGVRGVIGRGTLEASEKVTARTASVEDDPVRSGIERIRDVDALLGRVAGLLLIACPCGVRIRVPPSLDTDTVPCPRCGARHPVPRAAPSPAPPGKPSAEKPLAYERRGEGWESFECSCGKAIHLSPALEVASVRCAGCGRRIEIRSRAGAA